MCRQTMTLSPALRLLGWQRGGAKQPALEYQNVDPAKKANSKSIWEDFMVS